MTFLAGITFTQSDRRKSGRAVSGMRAERNREQEKSVTSDSHAGRSGTIS